jgi:hypothetical protein
VLTRRQWKDVVEFSRAVDARIVTSFATSAGVRDAAGVWTPAQARQVLAYTKSIGGSIAAAEYMKAFDTFSYHFYGAISKRCAGMVPEAGTTPEDALSEQWLARSGRVEAFYAGLRDRFAPGKPLWLTETADAACGGNPWGSTFLDSFRYLDQLGRLARNGVQVVAHNTLASSDYGLLDENTLVPRPNYWSALLWRRLMGAAVLNPGSSPAPALHLYAHCLRGHPGGVALLAINTDRTASQSLDLPTESDRYTLTARNLEDTRVDLNGNELRLGANDELPRLAGVPTESGRVTFAPARITLLAIPNADNGSCR